MNAWIGEKDIDPGDGLQPASPMEVFQENPKRFLKTILADYGYSLFMINGYELIRVKLEEVQVNTLVDYLCVKSDTEAELFHGDNWIIREPLTDDERLAMLAAEAKIANPSFRSSVITVLDKLDPALLETELGREIITAVQD